MSNVITMNPLVRLLEDYPERIRGMFGELYFDVKRIPHFPSKDVIYSVGIYVPDIRHICHEYLFEVYPEKRQYVFKPINGRFTDCSDFDRLDDDLRGIYYSIMGNLPLIPKSMFGPVCRKEVFEYIELDANIRNACSAGEVAEELSNHLVTLAHVDTVHLGMGLRFKTEPHTLTRLSKEYKNTVTQLNRWGYSDPEFLDQIPATGLGDYKFKHFGREVLYTPRTGKANLDGSCLGQFRSLRALVAQLNVIGNKDK